MDRKPPACRKRSPGSCTLNVQPVSILVVLDDWFGDLGIDDILAVTSVSILVVLDDWFGVGNVRVDGIVTCEFQSLLFWMIGSGWP